MTDKIVVLSACDSAEQAEKIGRALVEKRLAACVNVLGGLRSFYRWKGALEDASEWLLLIKTRRSLFPAVREEIKKLHSYETPELVALPIVDGAEGYLAWMDAELAPED